jgi:hypothetical protein
MSLHPHEQEGFQVELQDTGFLNCDHRLGTRPDLIKKRLLAQCVTNTHDRAETARVLRLALECPIQNEVEVRSGLWLFLVNKLAWLKLEYEGVYDNILVAISWKSGEEWVVQSYLMQGQWRLRVTFRVLRLELLQKRFHLMVLVLKRLLLMLCFRWSGSAWW